MILFSGPGPSQRLGDFLLGGFASGAETFRGAAAFARRSGVRHLSKAISDFSGTRPLELVVGVDLQGTSVEALEELLACGGPNAVFSVFHNPGGATFHPKVYRFARDKEARLYVGSGNLTQGGLYSNYEAGLVVNMDRSHADDDALFAQSEALLDQWQKPTAATVAPLSAGLIKELRDAGLIASEAMLVASAAKSGTGGAAGPIKLKSFKHTPTLTPPQPSPPSPPASSGAGVGTAEVASKGAKYVMTLQNTDVGVGQTTKGTSKRSAEVFIPLAAIRANPDFWGWPTLFVSDPNYVGKLDRDGRGKLDRMDVPLIVNGTPTRMRMTYNPEKGDVRLGNGPLRDSGNVGDVLELESQAGASGYVAKIVNPANPRYSALIKQCSQKVRAPSKKWFGYP
jgi:HKD family nuclease